MSAAIPVKIRRLSPHARIPTYGTAGAAAFDLYAATDVIIAPGETTKVPLGFAVEIPDGYGMFIVPRSGISLNTRLRVANSPGVVDRDFTGEVAVLLEAAEGDLIMNYAKYVDGNFASFEGRPVLGAYVIRRGDRIAQALILPIPRVSFMETDEELTETERGDGGFGSTGVSV